MGFEIVVSDNTYKVKVVNEPTWVVGLQLGDGPTAVGEEACLVVAFSVWSTPDREAAYRAIEIARRQANSPRIYLLPYDYSEELESWLPTGAERPCVVVNRTETRQGARQIKVLQQDQTSPMWLVMHNHKSVETRQGRLRDAELIRLLGLLYKTAANDETERQSLA